VRGGRARAAEEGGGERERERALAGAGWAHWFGALVWRYASDPIHKLSRRVCFLVAFIYLPASATRRT
jgi:hypothetical protein